MAKSGPTSFGYRREGERLVLNENEAPIRKRIYDLFLKHQRKKTVAEILNAEGFQTRSGSSFSSQTVGRLLADDTVLGDGEKIARLISDDIFESCQTILFSQNKKGGAKRLPRHLFSGLAFCECGGKMYVPSASQKYVCRTCKAKILSTDLEEIFLNSAKQHYAESSNLKILTPFKEWRTLSLRSKVRLTQLTAARIDVNSKTNNISISLYSF